MDDFKHALISSAYVDRGITDNDGENYLPNRFWFFRKSFNVRSNASKDFLCAIVQSSQIINLL